MDTDDIEVKYLFGLDFIIDDLDHLYHESYITGRDGSEEEIALWRILKKFAPSIPVFHIEDNIIDLDFDYGYYSQELDNEALNFNGKRFIWIENDTHMILLSSTSDLWDLLEIVEIVSP